MERLRNAVSGCLMHLFWLAPIRRNKVIFKSFRGQNYGDNPRAIYEELRRRRPDLRYIWVMKDPTRAVPGAEVVKNGSLKELYHLATAALWVDNKRKGMWCTKRRGQFYVQTWHAGICGKKVEADARGALSDAYLKNAAKDSRNADLFLSDSEWTTRLYRRAFFYDGEILPCGLPRADCLFADQGKVKAEVYRSFHLDPDVHLVIYAPTFRVTEDLTPYSLDVDRLLDTLRRKYGGVWKAVLRLHPNIAQKSRELNYGANVIDGSQYDDIDQLIAACDALVTDYSSCMFDAMEAGKPVFLFATDIKSYQDDRGTYFSFDELPFSLAEDNDRLCENVRCQDDAEYRARVERFMAPLGFYEAGRAAQKTVDYLLGHAFR